jgi:hypothetical protein
MYVAYVGVAGGLKPGIIHRLVRRDSSVATGTSAVVLNPDYVTELRWWEHPDFAERYVLYPGPETGDWELDTDVIPDIMSEVRDREAPLILAPMVGGELVHLCGTCGFALSGPAEPCPHCALTNEDVAAALDAWRVARAWNACTAAARSSPEYAATVQRPLNYPGLHVSPRWADRDNTAW